MSSTAATADGPANRDDAALGVVAATAGLVGSGGRGRVKRALTLTFLALAFCTSLAACGSDKESAQEATQNLCTSLDDFAASVVALQGVGLNSSKDQISSALDNINQAWNKVVADAKDVKSANTDAVKSAYDDLKDAVQNRPTDKPITDVIAGIEPKLTAFAGAWKQFANSLDCKSSS